MNSEDMSELARIYCLVAKMNLIMVRVEGMKAFNRIRELNGMSFGYEQDAFDDQEKCLMLISEELLKGKK